MIDSMDRYCVPARTIGRIVWNLSTQLIPVARIERVAPASPAGRRVVKIPGLASSTFVSIRFESPAAVSTAIASPVAGGTLGQRKSIWSDEAYKIGV